MNKPLLFAMLCFLAVPAAYCQKIEKYFDYRWQDTDAVHARFYSLVEKTDSGWRRRNYFLRNLSLQMEGLYADSACAVPSGHFRTFHSSRIIESIGAYRNGKMQGLWLRYYSDGLMEDSTVYDNGNPVGIRQSWYHNGYPRDSCNYNPDGSGVQLAWFDNGMPAFAGRYAAGYRMTGKWVYFYKNGGTSAEETYDLHGRLSGKRYYTEKGTILPDTANQDRSAAFPGGPRAWARYLDRSLYFPDQYHFTNGDPAVVIITATVDEDGKVVDAEVAVPFYPAFDKIALEAVEKSPNWIPAFEHNRKIRYGIRQPVEFRRTQ